MELHRHFPPARLWCLALLGTVTCLPLF